MVYFQKKMTCVKINVRFVYISQDLQIIFAVCAAGKILRYAKTNSTTLMIWKYKREISPPHAVTNQSAQKNKVASDYYYYQIHVNGPICLYAGYGEMVVTKTKGARSCEVVKEKRDVEIETCISSSMCYLAAITTLLLHSCHKGL